MEWETGRKGGVFIETQRSRGIAEWTNAMTKQGHGMPWERG